MITAGKIFTGDVRMMYPKQWIVMVELEHQNSPYAVFGLVHYVSDDEADARRVMRELDANGDIEKTMIVRGWDDTPQIGGLTLWNE